MIKTTPRDSETYCPIFTYIYMLPSLQIYDTWSELRASRSSELKIKLIERWHYHPLNSLRNIYSVSSQETWAEKRREDTKPLMSGFCVYIPRVQQHYLIVSFGCLCVATPPPFFFTVHWVTSTLWKQVRWVMGGQFNFVARGAKLNTTPAAAPWMACKGLCGLKRFGSAGLESFGVWDDCGGQRSKPRSRLSSCPALYALRSQPSSSLSWQHRATVGPFQWPLRSHRSHKKCDLTGAPR